MDDRSHSLHRLRSAAAAALLAVALVVLFCLGLLSQDPHIFWNDDYQAQYLPVFQDIARAWDEGELPLLSLDTWAGGALAGEYQYGTFSVFINLCIVLVFKLGLGLAATAAALSLIHLSVLAAGTCLLALHRGLSVDLAVLTALAVCLNGWLLTWAAGEWVPALHSFAWLPWAWLGLERSLDPARGPWRALPAAIFLYLILSAGWPFTVRPRI